MPAKLDMVIVGSGPGGMAAGILAKQKNLSYLTLKKTTPCRESLTPIPREKRPVGMLASLRLSRMRCFPKSSA